MILLTMVLGDGHWTGGTRYPELSQVQVPLLHDDRDDELFWRDFQGNLRPRCIFLRIYSVEG